jgi:hypothetical protein
MAESSFHSLRLGEILAMDPQGGTRQQPTGAAAGIPYISTATVSQGASELTEVPTELTFSDPKGRLTALGDLLLVGRGVERKESVGCGVVRFEAPAAYSESLIRLRVDPEKAEPAYVRLFLTSRQGGAALAAAATGSIISNLRREALRDVEIWLPEIETQKATVTHLHRAERAALATSELATMARAITDTLREGFAAGIFAPVSHASQSRPEAGSR